MYVFYFTAFVSFVIVSLVKREVKVKFNYLTVPP